MLASTDLALFYWRFAATVSRRFSYSFMQRGRRVAAPPRSTQPLGPVAQMFTQRASGLRSLMHRPVSAIPFRSRFMERSYGAGGTGPFTPKRDQP
jgi:hypothetical protein